MVHLDAAGQKQPQKMIVRDVNDAANNSGQLRRFRGEVAC